MSSYLGKSGLDELMNDLLIILSDRERRSKVEVVDRGEGCEVRVVSGEINREYRVSSRAEELFRKLLATGLTPVILTPLSLLEDVRVFGLKSVIEVPHIPLQGDVWVETSKLQREESLPLSSAIETEFAPASVQPPSFTLLELGNLVMATKLPPPERVLSRARLLEAKGAKGFTPLEGLFHGVRKLINISSTGLGEPVVVVLTTPLKEREYFARHYFYLIWSVCRELYREIAGSYPEPVYLDLAELVQDVDRDDRLGNVELRRSERVWLRLQGYPSGRVMVLDCRGAEVSRDGLTQLLRRKFVETYSQGLGFVILLALQGRGNELKKCILKASSPYKPLLLRLSPYEPLYTEDRLADVLAKCFRLNKDSLLRIAHRYGSGSKYKLNTLDTIAAYVDRRYRDLVKKALFSRRNSKYLTKLVRVEPENEEHLALKLMAIKHLHEREGVPLSNIHCEERVDGNIPDIKVDERLIVECETLLGVGPCPVLKIFKTINKYRGQNRRIWVVVRNWAALLHLGDLYWAEHVLREEGKVDVTFFIPDFEEGYLVKLDEVWNDLR